MRRGPISWFLSVALVLLFGFGIVLSGCGDDEPSATDDSADDSSDDAADDAADSADDGAADDSSDDAADDAADSADDGAADDSSDDSADDAADSADDSTDGGSPAQPALWPAADVYFGTPEEAATDFVESVFRVPAVLGPFMQGDSRSGEIEVFVEVEGGGSIVTNPKSLLLMRQLAPSDGWFVIAAVNDQANISVPESLAEVVAGPVEVQGEGVGFEATVVVEAYIAGDAAALLDEEITAGGPYDVPEPFAVTLDLSGARVGDIVMLLVRGGTGLETDPGEFGAIPVVIVAG